MKISVVMASYNGEKYIKEQMDSIRLQTKKVDEVVISDDASSDRTLLYIQEYIEKYKLDGWKIVNAPRKGITANFYNGVDAATGDIIFFSDQDDIWNHEKIEKMLQPFQNPNILTVTCRRKLIDQNGKATSEYPEFIIYPHISNTRGRQLVLFDELKYLTGSGLCLAFKKTIFDEVKEFVEKYSLQYDLPFTVISAIKGGNYALSNKYVLHRIHMSNASSPINSIGGRKGKEQHQLLSHTTKKQMLEAVLDEYSSNLTSNEICVIKKAISRHNQYIEAIEEKKMLNLIGLTIVGNRIINRFLGLSDIISIL